MTIENVDQFIFGGFVNKILTNIETHHVNGGYDDRKIFIWDNLSTHKTPCVTNIIEDRASPNRFHRAIGLHIVRRLHRSNLYFVS